MAITAATSGRRDKKTINSFEGQENVINLKLDKKLELQMKTKAMLDELKNEPEKKYFQEKYDELLDINKNNTETELELLNKTIFDKYTEIKGQPEAKKISDMIDAKLAKLETREPIDDFAEKMFDLWIDRAT